MWRVSILANAALMGLFWVMGQLPAELLHNRFVRYPDKDVPLALPAVSHWALTIRELSVLVPLGWLILCILIWRRAKADPPPARTEHLLAFTVITVTVGTAMVFFFAAAGLLPFLRIGTGIG